MNYVAMVYRTGGDFLPLHVSDLFRNLKKHITVPFKVVLLTNLISFDWDNYIGEDSLIVPLQHRWRGWWSKIELFRPGIWSKEDTVVYMDLDTVITGNVDWLFTIRNGSFIGLQPFRNKRQYDQDTRKKKPSHRMASGLMGWKGVPPSLPYERFLAGTDEAIERYARYGDQMFIADTLLGGGTKISFWQDLFPGRVISYKRTMKEGGMDLPPKESSVVCFHGIPRPWDCGEEWVKEERA